MSTWQWVVLIVIFAAVMGGSSRELTNWRMRTKTSKIRFAAQWRWGEGSPLGAAPTLHIVSIKLAVVYIWRLRNLAKSLI